MNKELLEVEIKSDKKIIIESLSRIGISDKKRKILYPSCYLYEKDNKYYIAHFKQLFLIDGNEDGYDNISDEDICRRNSIVFCLKNWGLVDVDLEKIKPFDRFVFVLPHSQKKEWKIFHKYTITKK
jgi:hypothetical protein